MSFDPNRPASPEPGGPQQSASFSPQPVVPSAPALQVRKGKTPEEAEAEGRTIGLSSPVILDAMKRVLAAEKR